MTNKEKLMQYARKRLYDKAYKQRKAKQDVIQTYTEGFERCSKHRRRAGQQ